jgi:flagellar operon protein
MVDKIFYPQPIIPVGPAKEGGKPQKSGQQVQTNFKDLLANQLSTGSVKFSAHAQQRLESRNINLSPTDLAKISEAVDRAAQKGSQDSLIMMENLAFVVSVKNKMVITAMDSINMKDHVFTKIDSAVII